MLMQANPYPYQKKKNCHLQGSPIILFKTNFLDSAPTYRLPLEDIPRQLPLDVEFNVLKLVNSIT